MIIYDRLRVLMMSEDDSRCSFGLYGPLFHPYIVKKRPIWVVFQGACDGNARISRNISQKSKIKKNGILKIKHYACFLKARLMVMPKYVEI